MERSEWGKLLSFFPQADEIRGAFSSFSICVCGQRGTEDNALNYYPLSGRQKKGMDWRGARWATPPQWRPKKEFGGGFRLIYLYFLLDSKTPPPHSEAKWNLGKLGGGGIEVYYLLPAISTLCLQGRNRGLLFFCISSPQFAAPSPRKVIVFLLSSKSRHMPPHVRICNFGNLSRSERAREKEWGEFFLIQRWEIL